MSDLAGHSVGTMEGGHSPASVAMPRNTALTATLTGDPGTIAVIGTTKAELLARAKGAIECGERSLRDAAEALSRAQDNHGATQREMARAVGMSIGWVNRLLKWRQSGYKDASPFGPTTRQGRVQHAEHRPLRKPPRERNTDHRMKNAEEHPAENTVSTPTSANSLPASVSAQKRWSPREAKEQFKYAINQWWPRLDAEGRAEIISYFNEKTSPVVS